MPTDASSEQRFPETHREALRTALEGGGVRAVGELVDGFSDPKERAKLWALATRMASQDLRPREPFNPQIAPAKWLSLDELMEVYDAAIGFAAEQMQVVANAEAADDFKAMANVLSFNYAADLAPCWPGDDEPREARHYAKGVECGRRMVRWRIELNKKAENFALAHWALGVHLLGAGDRQSAVESFRHSLEHARIAAGEYGCKAEVSAEGDWSFILNSGYLGIAEGLCDNPVGRSRYEAALTAFKDMADEHLDLAEDANFGAAQLRKTAQVFGLPPQV